ncbi:MAG: hypothetical protein NTW06_04490 [Candidatus Falkowbacteria bacterium]|nr:hypothetical protein [Candidatus Falkowbacteria bacterium]
MEMEKIDAIKAKGNGGRVDWESFGIPKCLGITKQEVAGNFRIYTGRVVVAGAINQVQITLIQKMNGGKPFTPFLVKEIKEIMPSDQEGETLRDIWSDRLIKVKEGETARLFEVNGVLLLAVVKTHGKGNKLLAEQVCPVMTMFGVPIVADNGQTIFCTSDICIHWKRMLNRLLGLRYLLTTYEQKYLDKVQQQKQEAEAIREKEKKQRIEALKNERERKRKGFLLLKKRIAFDEKGKKREGIPLTEEDDWSVLRSGEKVIVISKDGKPMIYFTVAKAHGLRPWQDNVSTELSWGQPTPQIIAKALKANPILVTLGTRQAELLQEKGVLVHPGPVEVYPLSSKKLLTQIKKGGGLPAFYQIPDGSGTRFVCVDAGRAITVAP